MSSKISNFLGPLGSSLAYSLPSILGTAATVGVGVYQQSQYMELQKEQMKTYAEMQKSYSEQATKSYAAAAQQYPASTTSSSATAAQTTSQSQAATAAPPAETRTQMYMPSMGGMPAMVMTPFMSGYTGVMGLMDDTLPQFVGNPSSIRDQDNHNRRMFMYQQAMSIMQQFWAAMSQLVKSNDDTKRGMARNL